MVRRRLKDMLYLSLTPEDAAGMGPEKPMRLSIRRAAGCIVGHLPKESLPARHCRNRGGGTETGKGVVSYEHICGPPADPARRPLEAQKGRPDPSWRAGIAENEVSPLLVVSELPLDGATAVATLEDRA